MDTEILVDDAIDGGRELVSQLVRDGFDIAVAFWAQADEHEPWYLHIGSVAFVPENRPAVFEAVYASLEKVPEPRVYILDIKMIPPTDPAAAAAMAIRDRRPGRLPIRYRGPKLGNLSIREAYIYPAAGIMSPREVVQTVAGLMNRTGAVQPSVVTLAGGGTLRAIPVGLNLRATGGLRVTLRDVATDTDKEVPVEEIVGML